MIWSVLFVAALITSAISAVLGMAGGVSLLGVMSVILPAAIVVPLHGVVQLSSNATRAVVSLDRIIWRIALAFSLPLTAGVGVATIWWLNEPPELVWFQPVIGAFLISFLVWRRLRPAVRNPPLWIYPFVGFAVGLLSLVVGATGPLVAPFFLRDDLDPEETIATMAIVQTWGHFLKLPAFWMLRFDYTPHVPLLALLLGATVIGTIFGKRILERVPRRTFELLFELVLAALAIHLLF